jgi:DNA replicative helicase MCM subunit Mcm2 (Cdc46/Mcm family)
MLFCFYIRVTRSNMAQPILSRFDLDFILRDRADKEQDRLVSSNIMNLYRNANSNQNVSLDKRDLQSQSHGTDGAEEENRMTLSARLAWVMDFQKQPLPAELVRDYIAYAREYCKPKMTKDLGVTLLSVGRRVLSFSSLIALIHAGTQQMVNGNVTRCQSRHDS